VKVVAAWDAETKTACFVFFILLFCYSYFFPRWADWNQNSRLDQVMAIVDQRVLYIDDYRENTGDYAFFEGHYYSDKAPGQAFLGLPVYAAVKALVPRSWAERLAARLDKGTAVQDTLRVGGTGIKADKVHAALALYALTLVTVSIPSAFLGSMLYTCLGCFTSQRKVRLELTLAYGLATVAFPYAQSFVAHQLTAVCLFVAFLLAFCIKIRGDGGPLRLLIVGSLLGYSIILDYPMIFIAITVFIYSVIVLKPKRDVLYIIVALIVPGTMAAIYNYSIFHTPLPVAYSYSVLFPQHFNTGFMGFTGPTLRSVWGLTLSPYRGLFYISPFLLFSLPGFILGIRSKPSRVECMILLASVLMLFLFMAGVETWAGGNAVGPRHLCALAPLVIIPICILIEKCGLWSILLFRALALLSFFSIWLQTLSGQSFPPEEITCPLVQYSWPRFIAGDIARNVGTLLGLSRWYSLLPVVAIIVGGYLWLRISWNRPHVAGQVLHGRDGK